MIGLSASAAAVPVTRAITDWTKYVNLFIGTEGTVPGTSYNGGNVFPGATIPFGMHQSPKDRAPVDVLTKDRFCQSRYRYHRVRCLSESPSIRSEY